ncbi:MAG: beta strand repeat-containing protein, partial [Phycisphaerales bacterium]
AANEDIDLNLLDVRSPGTIALFTAGLGGNATITNATAVNLDESMVGGNLRATAATGNVTDAGTITVGGDAAFTASNANDDIVVNQLVVAGAVSVTTSGATGNATVVDNGPLDLGASSVGGNLTATAALGALTDSGTVAVGGNATFVAAQANADILLNQLAVAPTGLVSVTTSGANGDATIVNANSLVLGTSSVGRDFVVEATNGTVTDMGVSTVTGSMSLLANGAGGGVTADQIAVGGAILCNTSGSASITNTTEVRFSGSIIGDLMLTASSGRVVSNGSTSVGGMTMLTATGAGGAIDMTGLNATGSVGLNTIGNATVTNQQALDLKASSIGGDLAATATAGGITDSGAVAVTGATTLTASGTGGTINVNQIASVGGFSLNSSDDATITTAGAMQLNTSTVGGDLAATATTGTITDTGTIAVTGMTTLNAIGAGGAINVDQLASTGAVGLNTIGNATVVNAGALDLKASTVGMDLSATSTNGGITDSGTVTVAGNAAFNAASGISDANLDTLAIAGQVFLSIARDAFITNASDLTLGLGTVGRNLNATATTGILTDGDVLTVGGTASFATQATGALINLDQLAVAGTISLSTVGMMGSATIVNATGVELGSVTVGGDLRVTATTGNITDTGLVVAQGDATFATLEPSGQIDLDQTTMQPGRSLSLITTGGNARVTHVGSLTLGASGVGGDLTVTATGGVNQTAAISVNGATTINGSSSPVFDVNLSNPSNDFVGAVSVANASSIQISDANDLTLGEMSASGDTTLNAGGRLLDDGIAGTRVGGNLVTLNAGTGMGDATNRVQTRATNLVINAGTGDAFVGEADAVTLDSASASGQTVNLQNQTGDMTIDNDISGHYSLALETLDGDLNINSDVMLAGDSITNAGGNFTAHSSRNLTILGTINTSGFAGFASAGDIDLASGFASTTNSQFNIELPTYLLTINGDLLASGAGGDISLNSIAGMTRAVPGTATILIQRISPAALPDAQGNLTTRIEGASVTMGQNEKVVALGNLNFGTQASPMASATLGDVSVLGDLGVYANSITILRRDQSNLLTRSQTGLLSSTQDLGTDVVAGGQITLLSAAIGGGIGGGGITFSDSDADVANAGGFDVRKYGSGTTTISRQSFGIDPNTNMPTRIDGVDVFLDLTAQGPGQTNVAEIIAGAVPKEQGGEVSEAAGLDSGQKAKLKQLGIDPRDLTDPRALLAMLAGRALYDDYPAFGGRDVQYQVTVNRLPTPVVEDVLRAYEAVYSKPVIDPDTGQQAVDPQTGQPMTTSRATDIQQIFRASYDRYGEVAQDFEPTAFAEYIRTNPAETEAAQTLEQLRTFFARVDRLGLGPRERSIVRGVLLNYIKPQQLRAPGVMETVVFGSPNT